jgi:serine/threonine protein kinase
MMALSDAALTRLKRLGDWPDLGTPRYSIVEAIGRGGMGTVFLARDEELGRDVAIKIPHLLQTPSSERRLHTEARALAQLEHPGIVPIHDIGRLADGRPFYVMKRVRGRTLRDHVAAVHEISDRLRVFERICEPVAFAHARGFVHRDLKPDNVMVGAFGEVMVMDWGVVKVGASPDEADGSPPPADDRERTNDGTVIGTRGFMSPEQARGAGDEIDQRTDVYGLGAILFLLLTDENPAPDADSRERLQRGDLPKALRAICAKALSAEPASRYQTVAALAEDVGRYRAGRAVDAYTETIVERVVRFGRTYRTAIVLVFAYLVMRMLVAMLAGR